MVGRGGAELHRQPDARARAELAGVDPRQQAAGHGRGQHRARLVLAERAALAEHVDPAAVRRARVEHRAAHQVHVRRRVVRELGGHHVRAQVGDLGGDLGGQRHRAGLVGDGQPVARLALERRGALAEHLPGEPVQAGAQLGVGRGAGRGDRGA